MLIGNIKNDKISEIYPYVVKDVLSRLNTIDLNALPPGRYQLDGYDSEKLWFVILEYHTSPLSDFNPEVHRYHSDLQILLSGTERMAWSIDTGNHAHVEDYNDKRDILFYQSEHIDLNFINATPGNFYLFTPNVIHITNIKIKAPEFVRKLVVKIHNDLLVGA
ncbi:YhcH/YjgK/YiaL family protein [Serratia fonticola]|uniref:YhcH/YjgK/YiaL family protein n=1 Tax=Serratia fonticola TaxID=47917 RepID=A0A542D1Z1_SERFO|nr:YhcH/YjgK/YiaL family protein [Serratia fonticola]TQI80867.1 YhcH/YjgK/YiaL family protein [Serratia fonticola]TQI97108.1 YhcH/YjgK/YiaL family protein [Serratia fonticola]TVZ71604.1 YhcH/YjgK/YiaL family protein [Serratia fonticola]